MDKTVAADRLLTIAHTLIVVIVVAIIAALIGFMPLLEVLPMNPIAATGEHAGVGAPVFLDSVPIVADLADPIDHTVPAGLSQTKLRTTILALEVAVVAVLHALPDQTVTTASCSALGRAGIGIDLVAIITGFDPRSSDPITAAGGFTTVGAGIRIVSITVITGFDSSPNLPIASAGDFTGGGARIGLHLVAVVATFLAGPGDPIATAGGFATVRASIGIVPVPIVADFTGLHSTIATSTQSALVITTIAGIIITIIALLVAFFALLEIDAMDPITTAGPLATTGAGIAVVTVAVIAGFPKGPLHAVTASSRRTVRQARIGVEGVAIIATLAGLDDPITTACGLAISAFVRRVSIPIIAALTGA